MDFLQTLLDNNYFPAVTAFLLGLLTAISPCPLATNITAIGYISKDIENQNRIFINGLLYTLGRIVTYTLLGFILIPILREGASMFAIQKTVSKYGELVLSPVLIFMGLYMLNLIKINIPSLHLGGDKLEKKAKGGWGALFLGALFAFAFCPTSGMLYFGMLMPMSASATSGGYLLPVIFAIATGLPVLLISWILAYSISELGKFYNQMKWFEKWFRKIVAILFIAVGLYYAWIYYL